MARPLIEVYSVEIFPDSYPCQIYGDIYVYNEDDPEETYTLYERDSTHPEDIYVEGQLLMITGFDVPLSMPNPVMNVRLKKAPDEGVFVSSMDHLDVTAPNYDQDRSYECRGELGYVKVNYIAMLFGVVAELSLRLNLVYPGVAEKLKEPSRIEASDKDFPIYGTIVARYGKTYGHTTCDSSVRCFTLLKIPENGSVPLCFIKNNTESACLSLTRELVAVPAYSSLTVEVDLKESYTNKEFLHGKLISRASRWSPRLNVGVRCPANVWAENACLCLRWLDPSVDFGSPYSLFIEDKLASMSLDRRENLAGWSDRVIMLEVYSVLIGRENRADLSVFGDVIVVHSNSSHHLFIFKRDDKNAEKLVNGAELLSITIPEFMMADDYFSLFTQLKDANNHFAIPYGGVHFNTMKYESDDYKFDKLLCSVIEGEGGFVAVHYTVFSTAVGVEVKCAVICKSFDVANVYGEIRAWNDMFDYSSFKDDLKYYSKTLFEKSEKDNVDFFRKVALKKEEESLTDGGKTNHVEFSTSYVAMPIGGYTLFLDVDLYASSHLGRREDRLKDTLKFKLGDSSPMIITGEDFDILINLKMIPTSSWQR
ncbi:Flagellar motor switch protein FliN [Bienertia sinuspersici]